MPYAFVGRVTATVMALVSGRPPTEMTTFDLTLTLSSVGLDQMRVSFERYLHGPDEANTLRVEMPDGQVLRGPILDGRNEPNGGWLQFEVEKPGLDLDRPRAPNGWRWV